MQSNKSYNTSEDHSTIKSHIKPEKINLISLGTPTQIGLATKTLDDQLAVTSFFSVKYQSAGNQSNKQQLPFHPLRLNT